MDPDATLQIILEESHSEGDREALIQALHDLKQWLLQGGFMPTYEENKPS